MNPSERVNEKAQMAFWWCGVIFVVVYCIGLIVLSGFVPPPSPLLSGQELLAKYHDNLLMVRTGIAVQVLSCGFYILFMAVISMQMARMEVGRVFPIYSFTAFGAGCLNIIFFILPCVFWAGEFYRPDRNPELVLLISDISWLAFVMIAPPVSAQLACMGFCTLTSTSKTVVFPRWFGYASLWMAVLALPGLVAIYFYHGPFAWNGLIALYLPVCTYFVWMMCCFAVLRKAIKNHKFDVAAI